MGVVRPEGGQVGGMETERAERERTLNLLDGIHLRGLLSQPVMGESSSSLVDCLHLLKHL